MALAPPTRLSVFNMEPLKGGAVLDMNAHVLFLMIDRLLGGIQEQHKPARHGGFMPDNDFEPTDSTYDLGPTHDFGPTYDFGGYVPPSPTFQDVPDTHPFYQFIETAYHYAIISGYSCGSGCLVFAPDNSATRGQISKIVYAAILNPSCGGSTTKQDR